MRVAIIGPLIETLHLSEKGWVRALILAGMIFALPARAQFCVLLYHAHPNLGYSEARFIEQKGFSKGQRLSPRDASAAAGLMQYRKPLPIRPVLITVDDNYIESSPVCFPIFHARGQVAINFTPTNLVGVSSSLQYCTWLQLAMMDSTGVLPTESHTKRHPHLTELTPSELSDEIFGSKAAIESNIADKRCDYIAYPYGDYDASVIQACYDANYRAAFAVSGGWSIRYKPLRDSPQRRRLRGSERSETIDRVQQAASRATGRRLDHR
jgi:hypothetical protein